MDQSAGAAKTKCHKLGSLQNRPFFLTVLEAGRSRSRCQAIQFLVRVLFLAWRQLPSCCMSTWPFLSTCVRTETERESKPSAISSYKGTNSIMRGPPSWPCLTLNTSQTPHPQYYHIGIRASTYAFQENTFSPQHHINIRNSLCLIVIIEKQTLDWEENVLHIWQSLFIWVSKC